MTETRSIPRPDVSAVPSRLMRHIYLGLRSTYVWAVPWGRLAFSNVLAVKNVTDLIWRSSSLYERLQGTAKSAAPIRIYHVSTGTDADLAEFTLRMAITRRACGHKPVEGIELFLCPQGDASVLEYIAIARCFQVPIDVHIVTEAPGLPRMPPDPERDSTARPAVTGPMIGCFAAPGIYRNFARDYFKTIDSFGKYCVIHTLPHWDVEDVAALGAELARAHPEWYFAVIGDQAWRGHSLPRSTGNLFWPNRGGIDFRKCLGLVCEADAFVGPRNLFGLAALLSARRLTLIDNELPPSFEAAPTLATVAPCEHLQDLPATLDSLIRGPRPMTVEPGLAVPGPSV